MVHGMLRMHQLPVDNSDIPLKVRDLVFKCEHSLVIRMTVIFLIPG